MYTSICVISGTICDMPTRRQATVQQEEEIQRLTYLGYGPAQIYRELERQGLFRNHPLSKRTIERMVRRFAPLDSSGPWSFRDADPEDARLVLDVLVDTYEQTDGRVWLTNDVADMVIRLRKVAQGIPSQDAYFLARAYLAVGEEGDTRALDLAVSLRIWDQTRETLIRWSKILEMEPIRTGAERMLAVMADQRDVAMDAKESLPDSNLTVDLEGNSGQQKINHREQ
jgi:hypothetical protein